MKFPRGLHRSTIAAVLLFLPAALPQAHAAEKPAAAPPRKLDVRVLITAEPDKVFRPTKGPDGKFSPAQPVKTAPRGKPMAAVIFFKDCKPDASGNCNLDVDLQGVAPDGSAFENRKGAELWRGKRAPGPGVTQLGTQYMKIQIEAKDLAGTYRVIAVAHDRNSGATVRSEASFEVK